MLLIGEQVEPPSDKLGGEICIASRALVHMFVTIYIYGTYGLTTNTMPTRIVCAHSHFHLTLRRGNQITIDTESERERDCTKVYQR